MSRFAASISIVIRIVPAIPAMRITFAPLANRQAPLLDHLASQDYFFRCIAPTACDALCFHDSRPCPDDHSEPLRIDRLQRAFHFAPSPSQGLRFFSSVHKTRIPRPNTVNMNAWVEALGKDIPEFRALGADLMVGPAGGITTRVFQVGAIDTPGPRSSMRASEHKRVGDFLHKICQCASPAGMNARAAFLDRDRSCAPGIRSAYIAPHFPRRARAAYAVRCSKGGRAAGPAANSPSRQSPGLAADRHPNRSAASTAERR